MTNYFVRTTGSDAAAGTSAGAAWLTLGKALGASGIASGDTVYVGAGIYRANTQVLMTSPTVETRVVGDVDGAFTGDPGEVILTPWLTTDTAGPSGTYTLDLNGRDFLTLEKFTFIAPPGTASLKATTAASSNITVRECTFLSWEDSNPNGIDVQSTANVALVWLIERCRFFGTRMIAVRLARHTADYDADVTIRNCLFVGGKDSTIEVFTSGSGSLGGGGVRCYGCTFLGGGTAFNVNGLEHAITIPCSFVGCLVAQTGTGVSSTTPGGSCIEDYNVLNTGGTVRSNVAIGPATAGGSPSNYAPLVSIGQERVIGRYPREFGTPLSGSPLMGFGMPLVHTLPPTTAADDATVGTVAWTNPSNALLPENVNFAVATAIPATTGISHYLKITGGLAVPSGALIQAVRVEVRFKAASASAIAFSSVKLVKAGVISGNEHAADYTTQWGTSTALASLGSAADPLWGLTLTAAEVNAADFGVVISAKNTSAGTVDASIDYVRLIVAYLNSDGTGSVTVDLLNRPRPAGGGSLLFAVGALERHDTGAKETTTVDVGPASVKIVGPGDQEIRVPVQAASTVITVRARYDTTHGTTTKPQAILLANGEIGVVTETKTMTSGVDTWETLTFSAITPTAAGVVTIRLLSRPAAAGGIAFFDTVTVT